MNNKIQKFQYGGPVVNLQYKEPEVYIEEALVDAIQQYRARLESARIERLFDKELGLKEERFDKELGLKEEQFNKELKFKEDEAVRKDQLARHEAGLREEAEKRGDALTLAGANLGLDEEYAYIKQWDPDSPNIPIIEQKKKVRDEVSKALGIFSTMDTEEFSSSSLNEMLMQTIVPLHRYRDEGWAKSLIDIGKGYRKNITSQSILDRLQQNPDFKRVVGDILPSYDMSNASEVLSSVPAMWNMFSGTNKEKISALTGMLPFLGKLSEQGYYDESSALYRSINEQIALLTGLAEERVPAEKEDFVPQKPKAIIEPDKDYIINPPVGKSYFGNSNQARAADLRGGEAQEVQRFEYTQLGAAGKRYYPGDSGFGKFMAVTAINEPMLIGDSGYTKVVDKDGNVYTWMKQEVEGKRGILYQYLKDSSGREKKVFNMTFKENYSKLVIQRPDTRIDDSFWNRLNDTERSKFISNWNEIPVNDRPNFLNVWNKLTDAKKILTVDAM